MNATRKVVQNMPEDEKAFYEDEVDIHLNPKIGREWLLPGEQTLVVTPGKNEKRYIAGALSMDGRELVTVSSRRKNTVIFVLHFLPPYSPDENRIERLWREMYSNVTRNHRYRTTDELMDRVSGYLKEEISRRPRMATMTKKGSRRAA